MIRADRQGFFRPKLARLSPLLIGVGLLVVTLAVWRGNTTYQLYNSPFDEVDASADYEVGFLPLISSDETGETGADQAPALTGQEGKQPHPIGSNDAYHGGQAQQASSGSSDSPAAQAPIPSDNITLSSRAGAGQQQRGPQKVNIPDRIVIPALGVDAPVEAVGLREIEYKRQKFQQWLAPDSYAAGWHDTSAPLGTAGNTVLNGHHNAYGEIFKNLTEIQVGDLIYLHSGEDIFTYEVGLSTRFNERFRPVEERLDNARWILPSPDERLTIITCWPYESNTHRVVIVAIPNDNDVGTVE